MSNFYTTNATLVCFVVHNTMSYSLLWLFLCKETDISAMGDTDRREILHDSTRVVP